MENRKMPFNPGLFFCGLLGIWLMSCVSIQQTDTSGPGSYRVRKTLFTHRDSTTLTTHLYNEKGLREKSTIEYSNGEKGVMEYGYDPKDFLVREYYHAVTSTYAFSVTYENNELGKPVRRSMVMDAMNQSQALYAYNAAGLVVKLTVVPKNGPSYDTVYVYDDENRLFKTATSSPGGMDSETEYAYDKNGYLLEEKIRDKSGEISTIRYEYERF
jgi:YD repeat-containing protein